MKTRILIKPFTDAGLEHLNEVIKTMDNEEVIKKRIASIYNKGAHPQFWNVSRTGIERISGVAIDYRCCLKKILVKQYDRWQEYYAPNKTVLRRCLHGSIQEMVYINK